MQSHCPLLAGAGNPSAFSVRWWLCKGGIWLLQSEGTVATMALPSSAAPSGPAAPATPSSCSGLGSGLTFLI